MKNAEVNHVKFMEVKISNVSYKTAYAKISDAVVNNEKGYVCLSDVGNVINASKDEDLRTAINESLFSLADGMPLAWYARLVGCREIERISGVNLMMCMFAEKNEFKHFLLGDTDSTIKKVISEAKKINGQIDIVGHSPPYKAFDDEDNRQIMERIKKAAPDIVWVSFGGGKQEKWMHDQIQSLDRGVMIGVGAAFKWLIGEISTPPKLLQSLGLQWLYRMAHEVSKDPKAGFALIRQRKLLKNKLIFIANLPCEIKASRKNIKARRNA
jgi:N-acetylglucosaminyldiphosphoundecaprenol N-acetyl-beta-D-mannosaminyltransferase